MRVFPVGWLMECKSRIGGLKVVTCEKTADTRSIVCRESVTGSVLTTELRPHFVLLPLSETRVFSGFPQFNRFACVACFNPVEPKFRS